jgi:acetylornithine deacetylase/succinyl-diaminopimelate desuccinylase-like protein
MKNFKIFLFIILILAAGRISSPAGIQAERIEQYIQVNQHEIIQEFIQLLSIPNVSSDTDNIRKNAEFIRAMMEQRGIDTRIMETPGNPVVFGELETEGAEKTLMFYVHYDGQPVDPSQWTGTHPFSPALRPGKLEAGTHEPKPIPFPDKNASYDPDWRIYARGSSDDRAPITGILAAIDALREMGIPFRHNLKFILEGEEEAGSTHLGSFLKENKDLLSCDVLFMCDGPAYYSGDPTLFFGARGITSLEITVFGPNTSVHSGHYGNWAPNPAVRLAHLLQSMRDTNGRVKIKGFYDTVVPLTETEKKALNSIPSYEDEIKKNYGLAAAEDHWNSLIQAIQFPALNINGLESGWVGSQQRTIIPPTAAAALDIRMVRDNDPKEMVEKVIDHIRAQGYYVTEEEPDSTTRLAHPKIAWVKHKESGYKAHRTPMDHPMSQQVIRAIREKSAGQTVLLPSLGGSLPIYLFAEMIDAPIIGVPIANHDNNQHQPDENLRIGHLWKGIITYAAILTM